jgi:hypothetical protein
MLFDFDAFNIKPAAEATLLKVAARVRQKSPRHLSVEGHTDAIGDTVYNAQLSALRARSVARWLAKHNVMAASSIATKAWGKSRPIAPNRKALKLGLGARRARGRLGVGPFGVPGRLVDRQRELQIFIGERPPAPGNCRARRQGRHLAAALCFLAIEGWVGHARPIRISGIRSSSMSKDMGVWLRRHRKVPDAAGFDLRFKIKSTH